MVLLRNYNNILDEQPKTHPSPPRKGGAVPAQGAHPQHYSQAQGAARLPLLHLWPRGSLFWGLLPWGTGAGRRLPVLAAPA